MSTRRHRIHRRCLWLLAPAALAAGVAAHSAHAWTGIAQGNPAWAERVPFALNERGSEDLGIDMTEREVLRAMLDWTRQDCTSLTANYTGRTAEVPGTANNVIGWMETGWPAGPGVLGITQPQMTFWPSAAIVGASMWLNGQDHRWIVGAGGFGSLDTYSIVLHEGGHYYGLGHTGVPGSCMAAAYGGGVFTVGPDDREGICALYPAGKLQDCPASPCPAGQSCSEGNCLPGGNVPACQSDAQCAAGEKCQMGACGPAPQMPPAMPPATAPMTPMTPTSTPTTPPPSGPTVTPPGCGIDADCAPGQACMSGSCVGPGTAPAPMGPGAGSAALPMGSACSFDDECQNGLCQVQGGQALCTGGCSSDADCAANMTCNRNGLPPTCEAAIVPALQPRSRTSASSGGCSAPGAPVSGLAWPAALALLVLVRRRLRAR
jgi:hypothetical protein